MILIDMFEKRDVRVTTKHFTLENDILTLAVDPGEYEIQGKTITAVLDPVKVETEPLGINDEGHILIPIYASMIQVGINYIQLNFRWDENKLEQSPLLVWQIDRSLETTAPAQEEIDIITSLIAQANNLLNIDGGRADTIYSTEDFIIDGGGANGL